MSNTEIISVVALLVSLLAFGVSWIQMRIASSKVKLELYNKRFSIYISAVDYYQSTWHHSPEKLEEVSMNFSKSVLESKFLFDKNSGIHDILDEIYNNGAKVLFYKKYKFEIENNSTKDKLDLGELKKISENAQNDFEKNLRLLEDKIEKYINFKSVSGWTLK